MEDSYPTSRLYDSLSKVVLLTNLLKYGDRYAGFTMHKMLRPPGNQVEHPVWRSQLTYVDDLALSVVDLPPNPVVLDAGCGFGGTVFRWHEKIGGCYDGVTISQVQATVARSEARRRGLASVCRFYCRSYDDPLPRTYDAIVAIESLIHAPDFDGTLRNFAHALRLGGLLVVVDDVLADDYPSAPDGDTDVLRRHWHLKKITSQSEYRRTFERNNLDLVHEDDLSERMEIMSLLSLNIVGTIYRSLYAVFPHRSIRSVLSAQMGGVALQRLYLKKKVQYKLFVGRKGGDR